MAGFPLLPFLLTKSRAFAADRRGTSAIEFAVIAPLMITIYLGGVEISDAIAASRKMTIVARTVADLTSQASKITDKDRDDILSAGSAVATPYGNGSLSIVLSSVKVDNAGVAKVEWSEQKNGVARAKDSTVTLDAALAVPNTWLILGEATYTYVPPFGQALTGPINLSDKIYMRPRISPNVQRTAN